MLRNIKINDAKRIVAINSLALGYDASLPLTQNAIETVLADTKHHMVIVYTDDLTDTCLGYVHAEVYTILYSETMLNVLAIAVDPVSQHKGIGSYLLHALEAKATAMNIHRIRLVSSEFRKAAHAFYEANGYQSNKMQKNYQKSL